MTLFPDFFYFFLILSIGLVMGFLFSLFYLKKQLLSTTKFGFFGSQDYKMVLLIRTDLEMSKGKIAAQCCHACLAAFVSANKGNSTQKQWLQEWQTDGQAKITLKVSSEKELQVYFYYC
jgi:hypothetical protein